MCEFRFELNCLFNSFERSLNVRENNPAAAQPSPAKKHKQKAEPASRPPNPKIKLQKQKAKPGKTRKTPDPNPIQFLLRENNPATAQRQPSGSPAQPSPVQPKSRSKKQNPPAAPQIQKSNCKSKSKNPAKPPKTRQNSGPKPYTISVNPEP